MSKKAAKNEAAQPMNDAQPEEFGSDGQPFGAADGSIDDDIRDGFLVRVRHAWRDTVGAYATDEGETENLFKRLVSFGTLTTEEAKRMISLSKDKIEANRKELDERVDESIRRTTARFSIPSQADLSRVAIKLKAVSDRIDALEKVRRK
ncbi:MAG: hypothetical protein GY822_13220 [Deltaproteobacteria bacterium]|nr:hypothetical protein [Deltaproteobacteria bacterium]